MTDGGKNTGVAYFLWLIGGYAGLHHVYLGRDRQAFIWWATWGGFFGLGWLRDIFYIPQYVGLANQTREYVEEAKHEERHRLRPPWSTPRFCGEMVFGALLGFLIQYAIPDELLQGNSLYSYPLLLIGPFGTGLGVYLVANIGREQCEWKYPVLSSYLATPLIYLDPSNLLFCGVVSAVATSWKGARWRPLGQLGVRNKKHFCKRLPYFTVCGLVYLSLWGSVIYFNATITTKEGDSVKVREAINNFFKSPAWLEMKGIFGQLYQNIQTVGWKKFLEDLIDAIDPQGEGNALKVLGLESDASQEEITKRYRKLAKEWHPDRHKDPAAKEQAQEKFMEIQQAYETLSDIKAKRSERAQHSRSEF